MMAEEKWWRSPEQIEARVKARLGRYTPTDDEVRMDYAYLGGSAVVFRARLGAFDRWLAAHDTQVREQFARELSAAQVPAVCPSCGHHDYILRPTACTNPVAFHRGDARTAEGSLR